MEYSGDITINGSLEGNAIDLPDITQNLNDTDGSESLAIAISGIPDGVIVSDGNGNSFTATEGNNEADISDWDLSGLTVQSPEGSPDFELQIESTATESSNGDTETSTISLSIEMEDQVIQGTSGAEDLQGAGGDDSLMYNADNTWSGPVAHNTETGENVSLAGKNSSSDVFDGGEGYDTIEGTAGNDALFLDDGISSFASGSQARIQDVEEINMGAGDDIVDMTSNNYTYDQGIIVNGGDGDDVIWTSTGDDVINGGAGNDSMYGGDGSDTLTFLAQQGNDIVDGGSGDSWTDTLQLEGFSGQNHEDGWTLVLNDGSSIESTDDLNGELFLSQDAGGTITFDQGGSIDFDNIEKIVW